MQNFNVPKLFIFYESTLYTTSTFICEILNFFYSRNRSNILRQPLGAKFDIQNRWLVSFNWESSTLWRNISLRFNSQKFRIIEIATDFRDYFSGYHHNPSSKFRGQKLYLLILLVYYIIHVRYGGQSLRVLSQRRIKILNPHAIGIWNF